MSSHEDDGQSSSSPLLQSAQQPADQVYAENEDLDSASDYLSDALSDRKSKSKQSSPRESSAVEYLRAKQSTAEDEHQDFLDEDSQGSTSPPSRPNKFRGPASTWRNRNAPERDLAASLDQLQAKDLSVHLYNSFKLSQRNDTRDRSRRAQGSNDLEETSGGSKWIPPKVWTAWPLPPGIVPREHDATRWEEDNVLPVPYRSCPTRPGQYLQEMLVAQVLRKAKERFYSRQREVAPQSAATIDPQGQQSQDRGRDSNEECGGREDLDGPDQKPVVMADDQRASEILQATVQHMMTKLDDLLLGLHRARSAYLLFKDSDSVSLSQNCDRSTTRGRPQKRKRKASNLVEDAELSHVAQDHSSSNSSEHRPSRKNSGSKGNIQKARSAARRSRSQKFRSRKARIGLRDWSDVLGIASMTAWHQNVVGSAAARCATLFGEGIKFRTLEEGNEAQEEHVYLPDTSPPVSGANSHNNTWRPREGPSNTFVSGKVGGSYVDDFLKPIEGKKSWIYKKKKQSKRKQPSRKSRESR